MPINSPTGFLDITNATLRTSNVEAENILITGGNIYVTSELEADATVLNLENVTRKGNVSSNTIEITNATTGIVATGNVHALKFIGSGSHLTGIPPTAITGTLSQWSDGANSDVYIASNVGIGNVHTLTSNTLQVGGNLYVRDTDANVLTVNGNVVASYFEGDGSKLSGIVTDLQGVTDNGNVTTNVVQFSNVTTGLVTTANIEVGGDIKVVGLTAGTVPYTASDKFLKDSFITMTGDATVITSNLDVTGNIFMRGKKFIVESETKLIKDAIIGIANNNAVSTTDKGIIMQNTTGNVAIIHHGTGDGFADQLTFGYTADPLDTVTVTNDLTKELTVNVLGNVITQNNLSVGGTLSINTISAASSHSLQAVTNLGNVTSNTVQFSNAITSLVASSNIVATGNVTAGYDTNTTSYFGRAAVGYMGNDNHASFAHVSQNAPATYALKQTATGPTYINTPGPSGHIRFTVNDGDVGAEKMRITGAGNVGIGVSAPQANLHVEGNVYVSSNLTASGNVVAGYLYGDGSNISGISSTLQAITDSGPGANVTSNTVQFTNATTSIVASGNVEVGGDLTVSGNVAVDTNTLFVDSVNNRVGVGTVSPGAELSVVSDSKTFTDLHIQSNLPYDGTNWIRSKSRIFFRGNASFVNTDNQNNYGSYIQGGFRDGYNSGQNWSNGVLSFFTKIDPGNDVEAMTITNGGRVGVGTTSPDGPLHIYKSAPNNGDTGPGIILTRYSDTYGGCIWSESNNSIDGLYFNAVNNVAGAGYGSTPKMVINSNGNVGLGTSNPAYQLDVQGSTAYDGSTTVRILNPANAYGRTQLHLVGRYQNSNDGWNASTPRNAIMFKSQTSQNSAITNQWTIQSFPSNNDLGFLSGTNNTPRVVFRGSNGNVAIGTTNAGVAKLHVIGSVTTSLNARYYNSAGDSANTTWNRPLSGYFGSHLACSELQVFSDRRIKTEIEDINDGFALELFRQIQPKTYEYLDKVEKGNERVYGFIAQEIKELIPEAVDVSTGKIPNIYEIANVSNSNVITFTHFNTSNLASNSNIIEVQTVHGESQSLNIAEVIDEHAIRVEEDLSEWIGSVDESGNVTAGNELFVYGQEVNDFHHLKKSAIFTVTTAALQEVDRQLQDTKAQLATVIARLDALENA